MFRPGAESFAGPGCLPGASDFAPPGSDCIRPGAKSFAPCPVVPGDRCCWPGAASLAGPDCWPGACCLAPPGWLCIWPGALSFAPCANAGYAIKQTTELAKRSRFIRRPPRWLKVHQRKIAIRMHRSGNSGRRNIVLPVSPVNTIAFEFMCCSGTNGRRAGVSRCTPALSAAPASANPIYPCPRWTALFASLIYTWDEARKITNRPRTGRPYAPVGLDPLANVPPDGRCKRSPTSCRCSAIFWKLRPETPSLLLY